MNDLIRHLYRNYVKTYAIRTKLEDVEYKGYPSEDNFIKMYIPMENIHLEIFYGDKAYSIIHTLYLQLRNYNVEVQVASEHFKHQGIDMFTKKMDLDNLEFKVFFLTRRIMETEYEIWGNTDNVWSGMFNALMLGVNKKK